VVGVESPAAVGCQPIQMSGKSRVKSYRQKKSKEGRRKQGHSVSKCPTIPAEQRGDSVI